jgi:hypothetical protein
MEIETKVGYTSSLSIKSADIHAAYAVATSTSEYYNSNTAYPVADVVVIEVNKPVVNTQVALVYTVDAKTSNDIRGLNTVVDGADTSYTVNTTNNWTTEQYASLDAFTFQTLSLDNNGKVTGATKVTDYAKKGIYAGQIDADNKLNTGSNPYVVLTNKETVTVNSDIPVLTFAKSNNSTTNPTYKISDTAATLKNGDKIIYVKDAKGNVQCIIDVTRSNIDALTDLYDEINPSSYTVTLNYGDTTKGTNGVVTLSVEAGEKLSTASNYGSIPTAGSYTNAAQDTRYTPTTYWLKDGSTSNKVLGTSLGDEVINANVTYDVEYSVAYKATLVVSVDKATSYNGNDDPTLTNDNDSNKDVTTSNYWVSAGQVLSLDGKSPASGYSIADFEVTGATFQAGTKNVAAKTAKVVVGDSPLTVTIVIIGDAATITYDLNSETASAIANWVTTKGTAYAADNLPTEDNTAGTKEIVGWYTETGCTTAINVGDLVTADAMIYAKWETKPVITNNTGATIEINGDDVTNSATKTVGYGSTVTIKYAGTLTFSGLGATTTQTTSAPDGQGVITYTLTNVTNAISVGVPTP